MTIRVFHCTSCNHHMRLTGTHCHKCFTPKPLQQRLGFWLFLFISLAAAIAYALLKRIVEGAA